MATFDTSMYRQNPLKSMQDYTDQYDQSALRQQQIQSNALAFQDRQRALSESQALRNALASGIDPRTPEGQQKLMTVAPNAAGPVIKSLTDAAHVSSQMDKEKALTKKTDVETAGLTYEQKIKQVNKAIADIAALSNPEEAAKGISDQVKAGALDMQKATALLQSLPQDPSQFGQWQRKMLLGILDAKERLTMTKPVPFSGSTGKFDIQGLKDPFTNQEVGQPIVFQKSASPDAELAAKSRIEAANITAGTKNSEPPVAVLNSSGEAEYTTRAGAIGKTPASMGVELSPKDKQKREAAYPKATTTVKAFETSSDTLVKDLEDLKNHPGLNSITGIAAGRLPGITEQGRAAQALYDKIVARGGFNELADMRAASPTGGALGNVSNAEGQFLRAAFAALDRRQDAPAFKAAIDDAITKVRAAKQNIRDAYELTYEYKGAKEKPASEPKAPKPSVSNW